MENKFKPCPFCGDKSIEHYSIDEDSFLKTLVIKCRKCDCRLEGKVDWKPFSKTNDYDGFEEKCLKVAITTWNIRY